MVEISHIRKAMLLSGSVPPSEELERLRDEDLDPASNKGFKKGAARLSLS